MRCALYPIALAFCLVALGATGCRTTEVVEPSPPDLLGSLSLDLARSVAGTMYLAGHADPSLDPKAFERRLREVDSALGRARFVLDIPRVEYLDAKSVGAPSQDSLDKSRGLVASLDALLCKVLRRGAVLPADLAQIHKELQALENAWALVRGEESKVGGAEALKSAASNNVGAESGAPPSRWSLASRTCAACVSEIQAWVEADPAMDYLNAARVSGICHASQNAAFYLASDAHRLGLPGVAQYSYGFMSSDWSRSQGLSDEASRKAQALEAIGDLMELHDPFLTMASWLPHRYGAPVEPTEFQRFCPNSAPLAAEPR